MCGICEEGDQRSSGLMDRARRSGRAMAIQGTCCPLAAALLSLRALAGACRAASAAASADARGPGRGRRPRRGHEPGGSAGVRPARLRLPGDPRALLHGHGPGQARRGSEGAGAGGRQGARGAARTYVRGVVGAEMPASWPLAALEAQAVASRTYALTDHAGGARFDVYADTRSQVYLGTKAQTPQTNAAVAATAGQVVTYAGSPRSRTSSRAPAGRPKTCRTASRGPRRSRGWWGGGPLRPGPGAHVEREHELRHGGRAPARPGAGLLPRDRGAPPRLLAADRLGVRGGLVGRTQVSGAELASRLGLARRGRTSACAPPTARSPSRT